MLRCSRAVCTAASYARSRLFATASFEARLRDCKALADNLQKIAEADRKFVTFEVHALNCDDVQPEIWDTQLGIADMDEMYGTIAVRWVMNRVLRGR